MATKPRVVVAAQPAAWLVLQAMLDEVMELVPVHDMARAFDVLEADPAATAMIISTVAFDDSRMVEFLSAVKSRPAISGIPFVCCRVLATVLPEQSFVRLAETCSLAGAADFINVPVLESASALPVFRARLMKHMERRSPPS